MEIFHMRDVIPLLPLPYPPNDRSSYYVPCPCCDKEGGGKEKHLNIDLVKDVFRCPRCGWNGGIFDLYALYTNTPRAEVRNEIIRNLSGNHIKGRHIPKSVTITHETTESPVAGIEMRDAVYTILLFMLTLDPDHMRNLQSRGLTEQDINGNVYRTTPVIGEKTLAKQLLEIGLSLAGVPGFYTDVSGDWTLVASKRGIMVPVRDSQGRIQGIQIRRDYTEKRKYRWLSSSGMKDGRGAEGWIHMAGPVSKSILLTEGPMKADIIHCLTGLSVLAVPGVNSLKYLEKTLAELIEQGVRQVMTAFDMDFLRNAYVQDGYSELVNRISRMGIEYGTYLWRPDLNGLDDYIWGCASGAE